jgi:hypothetical protein
VEANHVELQASMELSNGDIVRTQGTALSSTERSKPETHKLAGVEAELWAGFCGWRCGGARTRAHRSLRW